MDIDVGGGTVYTCDVWKVSRAAWEKAFRSS
jgi:hypothetical protein